MPYNLIEKTNDYLIVEKPAGLLTHGAPHIDEPSLAEELLRGYPEIEKIGEDPFRPGLVHRLDKMASGLLLVARTTESFEYFKKQFKERKVGKYYLALVHGAIENEGDTIDFPIKRSRQGNKMAAIPKTVKGAPAEEGRRAATEFWTEKRFINYTLLKVRIKTGRTHQIRCHLAAYGHPLLGDGLYGTKKTRAKNQKTGLDRIFLHACRLEFTDRQGVKKEYEIPLPAELKELLNNKIK